MIFYILRRDPSVYLSFNELGKVALPALKEKANEGLNCCAGELLRASFGVNEGDCLRRVYGKQETVELCCFFWLKAEVFECLESSLPVDLRPFLYYLFFPGIHLIRPYFLSFFFFHTLDLDLLLLFCGHGLCSKFSAFIFVQSFENFCDNVFDLFIIFLTFMFSK